MEDVRVLPGSTLAQGGRFRPKYLVKCVSNDIISPQRQLPTQLAYTNLMSWSHDLVKSSSSNLAYIPFTNIAPCNW